MNVMNAIRRRSGSGVPPRRKALAAALLALCSAAAGGWHVPAQAQTQAQAYPVRAVRIVVPFAPGAAADWLARTIANGLAAQWSQPVVVDNRPGANSIIGTEMVTRAEPDGHTLLLTSDDTFTTNPHLFRKLPYDPLRDLVPINLSAKVAMMLMVHPSVPVDSLPALIALARAKPGTLSYGTHGVGSSAHLVMEMFKSAAKLDILHVPYKGVAPAAAAAVAGEVQMVVTGYGTVRGQIDAGRLRPIAVAAPERAPELPKLQTMAENGYGEVDATVWWGFAAPAKTPAETVNRIHESISRILSNPDTRKLMEGRALMVGNIGPKPFAEQIVRESRARAEQVRRSGAKVDD
jgi:tripartite-type tricarboxylate transporter receptor subunit TctC